MAEAIAGLAVAANVAQFTEYAGGLLFKAHEISRSATGALRENIELEKITLDIKSWNERLRYSLITPGGCSKNEEGMKELAMTAISIATDMLTILEKLKANKASRCQSWENLRTAIRAVAKKKDIETLEKRLRFVEAEIAKRFVAALTDRQSTVMAEMMSLSASHKKMEIDTQYQLNQVRADVLASANMHIRAAADADSAFQSFVKKLSSFHEEAYKVKTEHEVLSSLCFPELKAREDTIMTAHDSTLKWLFERSQTSYVNWLERENGVYWVSGKAGSGKSTLMKYIYSHERTHQLLKIWSEPRKLVTAKYYFWHSGLPLQKSQNGLMRSLLYQILRSCPDLILKVCSDHLIGYTWVLEDLFKVFRKIRELECLPVKFCFFIDGLDEYEGDHMDIIEVLRDLSSSPMFKLCVSSRPWTPFRNAFGLGDWKLILQDLTMLDMENYVKDRLSKSDNFKRCTNADPECAQIVPKLAKRAEGVWLWVYLVVRDVLRLLSGHERYEDLLKKLEGIPSDLDKYFEKIFERINADRRETAKVFLITIDAVRPLPVLALKFLSEIESNPELAIHKRIEPIPESMAYDQCVSWTTKFGSYCNDLLEINTYGSELPILKYRVDFLHRTVRDFLRDCYQQKLWERAPPLFDTRATLCKMLLALLKGFPANEGFLSHLNSRFSLVDEFLYYARELEIRNKPIFSLLDELDHVNSWSAKKGLKGGNHWTSARDTPRERHFDEFGGNSFLALCIQAGLRLYVESKLDSDPRHLFEKKGRPLLDYALRPKRVRPADLPYQIWRDNSFAVVEMVELVLKHGADPNRVVHIYNGLTVWELFLQSCLRYEKEAPDETMYSWYSAVDLLITHGANAKVKVESSSRRHDASESGAARQTARFKTDIEYEKLKISLEEAFARIFPPDRAEVLVEKLAEIAEEKRRKSWGWWVWG